MREILFRGKDAGTGAWRIGDLMHIDGRSAIHVDGEETIVKPETVGQYTGRIDKNGERIFEGDIVRQTFEGRQYGDSWYEDYDGFDVGTVAFTGCGTFVKPSYGALNRDGEPQDYTPRKKRLIAYRAEVIGNVFDNPELLEASE